MKTFKDHLERVLKDNEVASSYKKEYKKLRIAYEVHAAREHRGWTQQQLAKQAGVTQQMISRIENATVPNISLKTLSFVGKALDLDVGFVHPAAPFEPTSDKRRLAEKKISV